MLICSTAHQNPRYVAAAARRQARAARGARQGQVHHVRLVRSAATCAHALACSIADAWPDTRDRRRHELGDGVTCAHTSAESADSTS
jgi:hypothetical protein